MARDDVVDWLLEEEQPSIRYRTLTELVGRGRRDREVRDARQQILKTGWGREILDARTPTGLWADGPSQYTPKYVSTHWRMLVLSDLGVTRSDPGIAELSERWMEGFAARGGKLGGNSRGTPHHCVSANMARALIRLGYADDPRVRRTLAWLSETADPRGGWSCWGIGRNLDSWEALSAFAIYPRSAWTARMRSSVEGGAEFFLARELHRQGPRYAPWYRLHYPVHYYYDLLVGLELLSSLGHGHDPRLGTAIAWLQRKRRDDGRWNLDAVHPDVEGGPADWFRKHPKQRPIAWSPETPGRPSKMVTFRALKVLAAVGRARARPVRTKAARRRSP
ncbi:MAG TPA: hypothetical protein VGX00_04070 [Thermoplasmata archaeon]|nr:hypothetical protein [Thermoplasmata archaeon]